MPTRVAIVFAVITVLLTMLNLFLTFVYRPWQESRRSRKHAQDAAIQGALEGILVDPVSRARSLVGSGSRHGPGTFKRPGDVREEAKGRVLEANRFTYAHQSDTVGAAFTIMWHLELVQLRVSRAVKPGQRVTRDAVALYKHVDLMARELESLLVMWSSVIDADTTVDTLNRALGQLPKLVDETSGTKVLPTSVRLPLWKEAKARSQGLSRAS